MSWCMRHRDLSGRARADKLDPSIIDEDLLHRRGGAQRAAILACERCSFLRCDSGNRLLFTTETDLQGQTNCLVIDKGSVST